MCLNATLMLFNSLDKQNYVLTEVEGKVCNAILRETIIQWYKSEEIMNMRNLILKSLDKIYDMNILIDYLLN